MPEKPLKESAPSPAGTDAPQSWTDEDQRNAEAFAKGFVALMLFARAQGIMIGFIGPDAAILNMQLGALKDAPDRPRKLGTSSKEKD